MSSDRFNHDAVKKENEKHLYGVTYWDEVYGDWTDTPSKTPGWYPDMRYRCNGVTSKLIDEPLGTDEAVRYYHASVMSEYAKKKDKVEYRSDITDNWTDTEGEPLWSGTTKYRCNGVESSTADAVLNSPEAQAMLYGITPDNPLNVENTTNTLKKVEDLLDTWECGDLLDYDALDAISKVVLDREHTTKPNALDKQTGGSHYKDAAIQPIEYIHANSLGFIEGNIVKYITRHKAKNGIEDIKKIKHYCDLLIELEYKNEVHK